MVQSALAHTALTVTSNTCPHDHRDSPADRLRALEGGHWGSALRGGPWALGIPGAWRHH